MKCFGGVPIMEAKVNYDKLWKLMIDKKIDSRSELSRRAGVSESTLSNMRREQMVSLEVLVKICVCLNCTLDDIVTIVK